MKHSKRLLRHSVPRNDRKFYSHGFAYLHLNPTENKMQISFTKNCHSLCYRSRSFPFFALSGLLNCFAISSSPYGNLLLEFCFTASSRSFRFAKRKTATHYFADSSSFGLRPHSTQNPQRKRRNRDFVSEKQVTMY